MEGDVPFTGGFGSELCGEVVRAEVAVEGVLEFAFAVEHVGEGIDSGSHSGYEVEVVEVGGMVFLVVGIVDVDGHLHLVGLATFELDGGRNGIVVALTGIVGIEHQTHGSIGTVPEAGAIVVVVDDGPCFTFFIGVDDGSVGRFVCGTCKYVVRCAFLADTYGIGGHYGIGVVVDGGEVGVSEGGFCNAGSHNLFVGIACHGVGNALTVVPSAVRAGFGGGPGYHYA